MSCCWRLSFLLFVDIFVSPEQAGLSGLSAVFGGFGKTTTIFFEFIDHAIFEVDDTIGKAEIGVAIKNIEFFDINNPVGEFIEFIDGSSEILFRVVVAITHRDKIVRNPFAETNAFIAIILAFGWIKINNFINDGFVELVAGGTGAGEDVVREHHGVEAALFLIFDVLKGLDVDFAVRGGKGNDDQFWIGDGGFEVDTGEFFEDVVDAIKGDDTSAPAEFAVIGVVFEVGFGADLTRNMVKIKEGRVATHLPPLLLAVVEKNVMAILGFELKKDSFELENIFALGAMIGMIGPRGNDDLAFVMG